MDARSSATWTSLLEFDLAKEWAKRAFHCDAVDFKDANGWNGWLAVEFALQQAHKERLRDLSLSAQTELQVTLGEEHAEASLPSLLRKEPTEALIRSCLVEAYGLMSQDGLQSLIEAKLADKRSYLNALKSEAARRQWAWYLYCLTFSTADVATEDVVRMPLDSVDLQVLADAFATYITVQSYLAEPERYEPSDARLRQLGLQRPRLRIHLICHHTNWAALISEQRPPRLQGSIVELRELPGSLWELSGKNALVQGYDDQTQCFKVLHDQLSFHVERWQMGPILFDVSDLDAAQANDPQQRHTDRNRGRWATAAAAGRDLGAAAGVDEFGLGIADRSLEFQFLGALVRREARRRLSVMQGQLAGRGDGPTEEAGRWQSDLSRGAIPAGQLERVRVAQLPLPQQPVQASPFACPRPLPVSAFELERQRGEFKARLLCNNHKSGRGFCKQGNTCGYAHCEAELISHKAAPPPATTNPCAYTDIRLAQANPSLGPPPPTGPQAPPSQLPKANAPQVPPPPLPPRMEAGPAQTPAEGDRAAGVASSVLEGEAAEAIQAGPPARFKAAPVELVVELKAVSPAAPRGFKAPPPKAQLLQYPLVDLPSVPAPAGGQVEAAPPAVTGRSKGVKAPPAARAMPAVAPPMGGRGFKAPPPKAALAMPTVAPPMGGRGFKAPQPKAALAMPTAQLAAPPRAAVAPMLPPAPLCQAAAAAATNGTAVATAVVAAPVAVAPTRLLSLDDVYSHLDSQYEVGIRAPQDCHVGDALLSFSRGEEVILLKRLKDGSSQELCLGAVFRDTAYVKKWCSVSQITVTEGMVQLAFEPRPRQVP